MVNVLIVDDSKFMRRMLSDILVKEGYQIAGEAENAAEAIELYKRLKPDLVTLDIVMPEINGINTISTLKAIMELDPLAKVVMVSAMGQEDVVSECIQTGAKHFIVKPFQSTEVAGAVKTVLKGV